MYLKSGKTKFLFYLNVIKEMQECQIWHYITFYFEILQEKK